VILKEATLSFLISFTTSPWSLNGSTTLLTVRLDVCDGFRASHSISPGEHEVSVMSLIRDDVSNIIKGILEGPYPGTSNVSA